MSKASTTSNSATVASRPRSKSLSMEHTLYEEILKMKKQNDDILETVQHTKGGMQRLEKHVNNAVNWELEGRSSGQPGSRLWGLTFRGLFSGNDNVNNGSVQTQLQEALSEIKELKSTAHDQFKENSSLKCARKENEEAIQCLKSELETSMAQQDLLRKQLSASNEKTSFLEGESHQLKAMILDTKGESKEPTAYELVQMYGKLNREIQTICFKLELRAESLKAPPKDPLVVDFYKTSWPPTKGNAQARRWRLQSKVFKIVKDQILDVPIFGAGSDCESGLGSFENRLIHELGDTDRPAIMSWRQSTMSCASLLEKRQDPTRPGDEEQFSLYKLLRPVIRSDNEKAVVKSSIERICRSARNLALRMRQSQSLHVMKAVEPGRQVTGLREGDLAVAGSESKELGESDVAGRRINYQLTGALVRYEYGCGEEVVLEPAQVIIAE